MKKLIVVLTLAAFATLSLQAEEASAKAASTSCEADACCAVKAKTSKTSKKAGQDVKGAQALLLLAKR